MNRVTHFLRGVLAAVVCSSGVAIGVDVNGADKTDALHADVNHTDVYLNDSFEAADTIATARRLASRGKWGEAAELLQRASDSVGDKLVRISPGYYVGVRGHIAEQIAGWPKAGLTAYRSLYEGRIQKALESRTVSRTIDDLLPLFESYFCTAGAAELADVIGQLAIESGDLALAQRMYRRVLTQHPDRASHASRCRTMLTLIAAMRGQKGIDLSTIDPDARIRWMGELRTIQDVLRDIGDSFGTVSTEPPPLEWPIFAGRADRNRRSSSRVDEIALLWRFHALRPQSGYADGDDPDRSISGVGDYTRRLSVQPVVSGGLILIQEHREIIALRCSTGVEEWRFSAEAGMSTDFDDFEEQPTGWDSVTVHDGRVYAVLPGDVSSYYAYESVSSVTELVCLDLKTGEVIWRSSQDSRGDQFAELHFDPSPIVEHGRMYVVGRRRRSFGFEDCYLYRFDTADGTLKFRTHLGSASTGTFSSQEATMAIPAMAGDTIYICTNLGSMAAVSAHTGAVRWLRLYQRDQHDESRGTSWFSKDVQPWELNPVIRSNGRIVSLPTDCDKVLVFAEEDGRLLQAVPTEVLGGLQTVLGVRGDLLCGAGEEVICYDLATETTEWWSHLPGDEVLSGCGVWVDDRLLVPTQAGLSAFRVSDGRSTDVVWDSDGETGNLLALPDQLIVAGATSITAYVRKTELWTALRGRMSAAPSDPLPALEFAEVAFGSGEVTEALTALDEAVRRGGDSFESIDPAFRARVFKDVLTFAEELFARSALTPAVLDKLFVYASQYPSDRDEHVRYRLKFGTLFEKHGRSEQALRLYQQILRDRSLREVVVGPALSRSLGESVVGPASSRSRPAGADAQIKIARLIEQHGPTIYAPYEAEAARWLESAVAGGDEAALDRIVETFPNSGAAPLALIAHGDLLNAQNRPHEAARRFAAAYHRYPNKIDRPNLMRRIADAYELAGKLEHAYQWLTKAVRENPGVLIDHDGRSVTFLEYRKRLAHVREKVEPSRPKVILPIENHFVREFEEGCSLLVPRFGNDPTCDWSRYYVYTQAGIRAFDACANAEVWPSPAPSRAGVELLIATSDAAVFTTPYEVFAVDPATGEQRWSYGEYPAHLDDPGAAGDWENGRALRTHTVYGNRLISVRDDGLITCIAVDDGRLIWSETHRPVPQGPVRLRGERVVYDTVREGHAVLHVLDAATGAWVGDIETTESHPIEGLLLALDDQVIVATSRSVSSYDLQTNRCRWRAALDERLWRASLLLDIDALYLSDDGRRLKKISLEDGEVLWVSQRLISRGENGLTVQHEAGSVIVSTTSSVVAVDAVTGLTLWRGTTPQRPRFAKRIVTEYYVMAVDIPDELGDAESIAYFYDHRNASGVIPRNGGATRLGRLSDIRAILAADGALLIQTGLTLHGWRRE